MLCSEPSDALILVLGPISPPETRMGFEAGWTFPFYYRNLLSPHSPPFHNPDRGILQQLARGNSGDFSMGRGSGPGEGSTKFSVSLRTVLTLSSNDGSPSPPASLSVASVRLQAHHNSALSPALSGTPWRSRTTDDASSSAPVPRRTTHVETRGLHNCTTGGVTACVNAACVLSPCTCMPCLLLHSNS